MTHVVVGFAGLGGASSTLVALFCLNGLLAYSAYVVMAGGAFSFAYVAFIAVGAYTGAILGVRDHVGIVPQLLLAPAIAAAFLIVNGFILYFGDRIGSDSACLALWRCGTHGVVATPRTVTNRGTTINGITTRAGAACT